MSDQIYKFKNYKDIESDIDDFLKSINKILISQLSEPYDGIIDYLTSGFLNIITSRAIEGTSNKFYDRLFAAYKSGG